MIKTIVHSILKAKNATFHYGKVKNYCSGTIERITRDYLSSKSTTKPPYHHICQIGDPVLRFQAEPVDLEVIPTPTFKQVKLPSNYIALHSKTNIVFKKYVI